MINFHNLGQTLKSERGHAYAYGGGGLVTLLLVVLLLVLIF